MSPTVAVPADPAPARRSPLRRLVVVLAVIVAAVVVIVGGVIAYAMLRPVGAPDYRKANSDLSTLTEPLAPLLVRQNQMMDLSLTPTQDQIDKAAAAQRAQLAAFSTAVTDYGSTRALRDPALKQLYDTLAADTKDKLAPMVNDFVDHYGVVLTMVHTCTQYDQSWPTTPEQGTNQAWFDSRIAACEKAVQAAGVSASFAPLVKVRADHITASRAAYLAYGEAAAKGDQTAVQAAQSAIAKAQLGIGTRMADATTQVAKANEAIYTGIDSDIAAIKNYCEQRS